MSGWSEQDVLDREQRRAFARSLSDSLSPLAIVERLASIPGAVDRFNALSGAEALALARKARIVRKSEREIERTCTGILKRDDWRSLKTDPVSDKRRGKGFGELGMADYLYIRYWAANVHRKPEPYDGAANALHLASGNEVLWVEWKRHDGKAAEHQKAWHAAERKRGALVLVAGEDFPASVEGFHEWYLKSGLCRSR